MRIERAEHHHVGARLEPCEKCGLWASQHRTREGRKQVRADGGHAARAKTREISAFVGVDGEGVTRTDGTHDYVLLTVGKESLIHRGPGRLTWEDIFPFLYEQFEENPAAAFVGYYLGYDFTQWIRTLSESRAESLWSAQGIARRRRRASGNNNTPFPVHVGTEEKPYLWEIDTLGMKKFKIRPGIGTWQGREVKNSKKWMHICDVGGFFQQSFLKTIEPLVKGVEVREDDVTLRAYLNEKGIEVKDGKLEILSQDEFDLIKRGKEKRASAQLDDEMIQYNALECDILGRVMPLLNVGFRSKGICLTREKWFGPGQAAQAWMSGINAPLADAFTHRFHGKTEACKYKVASRHVCTRPRGQHAPEWARNIGWLTYFGGWFEIFFHGLIPGPSHEYDVNSAYPDQISKLPCLLHGRWERGKTKSWNKIMTELYGRTLVAVQGECVGTDPRVGAMPHRTDKGSVLRPQDTSGWYWLHEVLAAMRAGVVSEFRPTEWVSYEGCDHPPPFSSMRDLYEERLKVGKESPRGKTFKLVYNSSYGKCAQSVGRPKFGNGIYASLITAGCRVRILEAIATHPTRTRDLLMVATDGVYFRTPHPSLDFDKNRLGAWGASEKSNLLLFMPGLYWDDEARKALGSGKGVKLKSRGVPGRDMARKILSADSLFARFDGEQWPSVELDIDFSMVTVGQALDRGKWDTCGDVRSDNEFAIAAGKGPVKRVISASPVLKRLERAYRDGDVWRSIPYAKVSGEDASTAYNRRFGDELTAQQGDLTDLTPDGTANELLLESLGMK